LIWNWRAYAQAKLQRAQAISNVIRARQALAAVARVINRYWRTADCSSLDQTQRRQY